MTINIVPLNQPEPQVIEMLEEILEAAKKGEVIAFSIVTINNQNTWGNCSVNANKALFKIIAGLEITKTELILKNTEGILS